MGKLPKNVIKELDKDIVDIIIQLNEIPFIQTHFSCAGHPDHLDPEKRRSFPYIQLSYDIRMKEEAEKFHLSILKDVPYLKVHTYFKEELEKLKIPKEGLTLSKKEYEKYKRKGLFLAPGATIDYHCESSNKRKRNKFLNGWRKTLYEYNNTKKKGLLHELFNIFN